MDMLEKRETGRRRMGSGRKRYTGHDERIAKMDPMAIDFAQRQGNYIRCAF
jgi:hypothetical protein